MTKYRIIGNMTGNSMDAIDLVLTEFEGDVINDICSYTKPYSRDMQNKIDTLRANAFNKTRKEIEDIPDFFLIHNDYINQIAECINEMCDINNIDKSTIDAIGFHGKTLDHNPPSKARLDGSLPYTLQIGSGQMLADLTGIPVIYDFRSDLLMAGLEGAPLIPPHNAHISVSEGDGCYYNGGNTSNFSIVMNGKALIGTDAGPFNEYVDSYIRKHTDTAYDKDGILGSKGTLNKKLLQILFELGRKYYEAAIPKSGDPAYYYKDKIFQYVENNKIHLEDAIHTFEYFASYIAAYTLSLVPNEIKLSGEMILFGGGWKNPIIRNSFEEILKGNGYILEEHQERFYNLQKRFTAKINIRYSNLGEYMEARLFADLARYKLENKSWEIPEIINSNKTIISGCIAKPGNIRVKYFDCINRAAKGWQKQ